MIRHNRRFVYCFQLLICPLLLIEISQPTGVAGRIIIIMIIVVVVLLESVTTSTSTHAEFAFFSYMARASAFIADVRCFVFRYLPLLC